MAVDGSLAGSLIGWLRPGDCFRITITESVRLEAGARRFG